MIKSEIAVSQTDTSVDAEFESKADDFAAKAEASSTREDCLYYREQERIWRLRADEERARQISRLYQPAAGDGATA